MSEYNLSRCELNILHSVDSIQIEMISNIKLCVAGIVKQIYPGLFTMVLVIIIMTKKPLNDHIEYLAKILGRPVTRRTMK